MPLMLPIARAIAISEDEVLETFVRASGPGGQNVNKTASAVHLRFDAMGSPNLPEALKARLVPLAGSRMTREGVIVIFADRFRAQERNRQDARERLIALLAEAAHVPKARKKTRPTLGSQKRRLESKAKRGSVKRLRGERPEG